MEKQKVYMVRDWQSETNEDCSGRILTESGCIIGGHYSSSLPYLRYDLKNKITGNVSDYEIVDLTGQEIPDRFKIIPN